MYKLSQIVIVKYERFVLSQIFYEGYDGWDWQIEFN